MQVATITSKYQLTLPILITRKLGLKMGDKMIVSEEDGKVVLTPAVRLVEELAGALSIPKKWKGKTSDEIIELAKDEYFQKKK